MVLESTAVNEASGCDRIPIGLLKTLKDDAINMLHSICQQIWKTQQWPKESANHWTIALISHFSKAMLKILNAYIDQ